MFVYIYVYFLKCAVQIKRIPATTTVAVFFILLCR